MVLAAAVLHCHQRNVIYACDGLNHSRGTNSARGGSLSKERPGSDGWHGKLKMTEHGSLRKTAATGTTLESSCREREASCTRSEKTMYICGRKIKIVTGAKSQTVNICTNANLLGQYDYRVRLEPPFISAETIAERHFDAIDEVVRFLERSHNGRIEQEPVRRLADISQSVSSLTRQSATRSGFRTWRDAWDRLSNDGRITDVIELWHAPVPDQWMRSESDTPARLLSCERYTRGNLNGTRRGEHVIEHEILIKCFDSVECLDQPLLDGVNAFPLVRDDAGGRSGNVEADLVLLTGNPEFARIFVCDVKISDGDPWKALLQNLRQLRLFTSNPICTSFFGLRGSKSVPDAKVVQISGGVIAPEKFYSNSDSLRRAQSLSEAISEPAE